MFTPAEIKAADDAFRIHAKGGCADDCGFCYDLLLAKEPRFDRELKRIADIKAIRRNKSVTTTKRVGKGQKSPLAGRVKSSKRG